MATRRTPLVVNVTRNTATAPTPYRLCQAFHSVWIWGLTAKTGCWTRGHSLRLWHQALLLSAALQQLTCQAPRTMKEISAILGFSSQGAFTRWFRRQTGDVPTAFRARAMSPSRAGTAVPSVRQPLAGF